MNLVFDGLTFTHADRFPWHGRTGWGIQHDWERFDSPSAMVRFRGAENCTVEHCHFTNAGSSGIRFDLYSQNNKVIGNHIEHIGGVGILFAGYGPGTKDSEYGINDLKVTRLNGVEMNSMVADLMFVDIENGDFSFKPESPALKLGLKQPVSIDSVGLEPMYRKLLEESSTPGF